MFRRRKNTNDVDEFHGETIAEFLEHCGLTDYAKELEALGATNVEDLTFLTEADLERECNLKLIQRRRFMKGVNDWKAGQKKKRRGSRSRSSSVGRLAAMVTSPAPTAVESKPSSTVASPTKDVAGGDVGDASDGVQPEPAKSGTTGLTLENMGEPDSVVDDVFVPAAATAPAAGDEQEANQESTTNQTVAATEPAAETGDSDSDDNYENMAEPTAPAAAVEPAAPAPESDSDSADNYEPVKRVDEIPDMDESEDGDAPTSDGPVPPPPPRTDLAASLPADTPSDPPADADTPPELPPPKDVKKPEKPARTKKSSPPKKSGGFKLFNKKKKKQKATEDEEPQDLIKALEGQNESWTEGDKPDDEEEVASEEEEDARSFGFDAPAPVSSQLYETEDPTMELDAGLASETTDDLYEPMEGGAMVAPAAAAAGLPEAPGPGRPAGPKPTAELIVEDGDDMYEAVDLDQMPPAASAAEPARQPKPRTEAVKREPEGPPPLPENVKEWLPSEVLRWLKANGLDDFKDVFYANGFAGPELLALTANSFRKGGFSEERCTVLGSKLMELRMQGRSTAAKPPPNPHAQYARVMFDFMPTGPTAKNKLQISCGELLCIEDDTKAWWLVTNASGEHGLVPSNYLEACDHPDVTPPIPEKPIVTDGPYRGRTSSDAVGGDSSTAAAPAGATDLSGHDWFHGDLTLDASDAKLKGALPGTFLVRRSSTNAQALTVCVKSRFEICNIRVEGSEGAFTLENSDLSFSSVPMLVEHYASNDIPVAGKVGLRLARACTD